MLDQSAALLGVYRDDCQNNSNLLSSWAVIVERTQREAAELVTKAKEEQENERNAAATLLLLVPTTALPGGELFAGDRLRATNNLHDARNVLAAYQTQATELRNSYLTEAAKHATGYRVTPSSEASTKAGLNPESTIGAGALAVLTGATKNPVFNELNRLRAKADNGDAGAEQNYFALLAGLSTSQIALYGALNQPTTSTPTGKPLTGTDPRATKTWWASLKPEQQLALIAALPTIIGNLNGIPYTARARANLSTLAALEGDPATEQKLKDDITTIRNNLNRPTPSSPNRYLIALDPNGGKPLAALAIGDLDTAGNVTWNIPGMSTTVSNGLDSWTQSAQDLYNEQNLVYKSKTYNPGTAVVSWLGYETPAAPPQSLGVTGSGMALAGADRLATALDGFALTRETGTPGNGAGGSSVPGSGATPVRVSVVAHSYGSTTAAYALTKTVYPVDSATFFGSAGIDKKVIPDSSVLNVASNSGQPNVYVTKASGDQIANLGTAGSRLLDPLTGAGRANPTGDWFGARVFSSEGGTAEDGTLYHRTDGHDAKGSRPEPNPAYATIGHGYLDPGTESAKNIALASTGNGTEIRPLSPLPQNPDGSYDETPRTPQTPGTEPRGPRRGQP